MTAANGQHRPFPVVWAREVPVRTRLQRLVLMGTASYAEPTPPWLAHPSSRTLANVLHFPDAGTVRRLWAELDVLDRIAHVDNVRPRRGGRPIKVWQLDPPKNVIRLSQGGRLGARALVDEDEQPRRGARFQPRRGARTTAPGGAVEDIKKTPWEDSTVVTRESDFSSDPRRVDFGKSINNLAAGNNPPITERMQLTQGLQRAGLPPRAIEAIVLATSCEAELLPMLRTIARRRYCEDLTGIVAEIAANPPRALERPDRWILTRLRS